MTGLILLPTLLTGLLRPATHRPIIRSASPLGRSANDAITATANKLTTDVHAAAASRPRGRRRSGGAAPSSPPPTTQPPPPPTNSPSDLAAAVHAAAAAFGPPQEKAAIAYTAAILANTSAAIYAPSLCDQTDFLFDQPDKCLPLRKAMATLLQLVAERSRASSVARIVPRLGLDARIDAAVGDVRELSAAFGVPHARAAVEWTDKVTQAGADLFARDEATSSSGLLERQIYLFDECQFVSSSSGSSGTESEDEFALMSSRCKELREAVDALVAWSKQDALTAAAKAAPPVSIDSWKMGDPMPVQLAALGCDETLWDRANDKKALVRLAEATEDRARRRIAKLRQVLDVDEALMRRAARAARRLARRMSDVDDEAVSEAARSLADDEETS